MPRNTSIVRPLKSSTTIFTLEVVKKVGLLNKYELAGASNAVPIDVVLGDEPIVVTPSPFEAWHGIVVRLYAV